MKRFFFPPRVKRASRGEKGAGLVHRGPRRVPLPIGRWSPNCFSIALCSCSTWFESLGLETQAGSPRACLAGRAYTWERPLQPLSMAAVSTPLGPSRLLPTSWVISGQ